MEHNKITPFSSDTYHLNLHLFEDYSKFLDIISWIWKFIQNVSIDKYTD